MKIDNDFLIDLYNLKGLKRYNTHFKIHDESVAEHSYYVSLFSMIIADTFDVNDKTKLLVVKKAMLHDLPEIVTSDIPHPTKERFPRIKEILEDAEDEILEEYLNNPKEFFVKTNKSFEVIADIIVKLADKISVIQFCLVEQKLGNTTVDHIIVDAKESVTELVFNYISNKIPDNQEKRIQEIKNVFQIK